MTNVLSLSRVAVCCVVAGFAGVAAHAAPVMFAGLAPNTVALSGQQSDTTGSPFSTTFATTSGYAVTRVEWWGYDLLRTGGANAFEVRLNNLLLVGTVGSDSAASFVLPDATGASTNVVKYFLNLAPAGQISSAGNSTSLSVYNNSFDVEWYWQGSAPGAAPGVAFALFGEQASAVPEPTSLALVIAALLGLAAGRRQQSA